MQPQENTYDHFVEKPIPKGHATIPFPEDAIDKKNMPKKAAPKDPYLIFLIRLRIRNGVIPINPFLNSGMSRDSNRHFSMFEEGNTGVMYANGTPEYIEQARQATANRLDIDVLDDDFYLSNYTLVPRAKARWPKNMPQANIRLKLYEEVEEETEEVEEEPVFATFPEDIELHRAQVPKRMRKVLLYYRAKKEGKKKSEKKEAVKTPEDTFIVKYSNN